MGKLLFDCCTKSQVAMDMQIYCQTSNISGTIVDNEIVDHSVVVGVSPVSTAPIFILGLTLASMDSAMTTRRDEKHLSFGIWCNLHYRFYGIGKNNMLMLGTQFCGLLALALALWYGLNVLTLYVLNSFDKIRYISDMCGIVYHLFTLKPNIFKSILMEDKNMLNICSQYHIC